MFVYLHHNQQEITMNKEAHTNRSTTMKRQKVRELKANKNSVEIEHPMPLDADGLVEETFSVKEIFSELDRKLKEHYALKTI